MTSYKEIHGTKVEVRDDDPANPVNGPVWYNSQTLKGFKLNPTGAFSTGGNMNTSRRRMPGVGTQTAALVISGTADPPVYAQVESYNGTAFSEVGDVNTSREEHAAGGTQASAIVFGDKPNNANTE